MKQDNWLVLKSHTKSLLTYNSTATMLISPPRDLKPRQKSVGTETHHLQPFPLSMVQIYLFIYFIYDKGPESATDMPMTVN